MIRMPSWLRRVLCRHNWHNYQHSVRAAEHWDQRVEFVIAFKVCRKCAAWKLIHILE